MAHGHGGKRAGSGRKSKKTEYEVKHELQKYLGLAYESIRASLEAGKTKEQIRTTSAYKLIAKFVGDRQAVQVTGDIDKPVGVVVLPLLNKKVEDKTDSVEDKADEHE